MHSEYLVGRESGYSKIFFYISRGEHVKHFVIDASVLSFRYVECTAVALGTVGTVPIVPLFLAGTANRTTISKENHNFEMKKGYSLILRI